MVTDKKESVSENSSATVEKHKGRDKEKKRDGERESKAMYEHTSVYFVKPCLMAHGATSGAWTCSQ